MTDQPSDNEIHDPSEHWPLPILAVRGAIAGVLMGLANLVPGVSGGTMLLAAGVYQRFIASIAEVTTLAKPGRSSRSPRSSGRRGWGSSSSRGR